MVLLQGGPVVVDVVDWGLQFAAGAADKIGEGLLDCCELATRFIDAIIARIVAPFTTWRLLILGSVTGNSALL